MMMVHDLKDKLQSGEIMSYQWIPTAQMWADNLTKEMEIPEDLKRSVITPIYKNGGKELPKNYRPVALTSHLTKAFERVVRRALVSILRRIIFCLMANTVLRLCDQP